jgi:hypothetical protein
MPVTLGHQSNPAFPRWIWSNFLMLRPLLWQEQSLE